MVLVLICSLTQDLNLGICTSLPLWVRVRVKVRIRVRVGVRVVP